MLCHRGVVAQLPMKQVVTGKTKGAVASMSFIDILFIVTVILLVFNGLRNGAIFSIINLVSLPIGFVAASTFGPQLSSILAANGLPATPIISYIVIFLGVVLIL